MLCETPSLSRRALLGGSASFFAWSYLPKFARAADNRDPRFLTIILRGALDGLSAVPPIGDPDYAALRLGIALAKDGDNAALPLDGFFALHPSMPNLARMYKEGHATVVHATASPYRERSHFDGQDVLESGLGGVGSTATGWLNRALAALPAGARVVKRGGLGIGPITPLILRGAAPVMGWAPPALPKAGDDLALRVLDLYTHRDPVLARALGAGLDTDRIAKNSDMKGGDSAALNGLDKLMVQTAEGAARLLVADDGPRIAALSIDGWDTHAQEGGAKGRLANLLGGLDRAFAALETAMKPVWRDTAVVVVTEFGRTAHVNGTDGTDHGTGTLAFLIGGAVKGGRVIADWPGLKEAQLFERRDLKATTDLRAVLKGMMADHLGLSVAVLGANVFPDSGKIAPMMGLII